MRRREKTGQEAQYFHHHTTLGTRIAQKDMCLWSARSQLVKCPNLYVMLGEHVAAEVEDECVAEKTKFERIDCRKAKLKKTTIKHLTATNSQQYGKAHVILRKCMLDGGMISSGDEVKIADCSGKTSLYSAGKATLEDTMFTTAQFNSGTFMGCSAEQVVVPGELEAENSSADLWNLGSTVRLDGCNGKKLVFSTEKSKCVVKLLSCEFDSVVCTTPERKVQLLLSSHCEINNIEGFEMRRTRK